MFSQDVGQLWLELNVKGGATVQDALQRASKTLTENVRIAKEYRAVMETPQGRAIVQQEVLAQNELRRAREAYQWQKLVAEQGRSGATLTVVRDRLREIGTSMQQMGGGAFFGAMHGMDRMAAAASPAAWSTWTGSVELLMATIGQSFVPALIQASRWVQDVAHWFRQLSPTAREWIGTIGTWTLVLSGGVYVIGSFLTWLGYATTGLRLLAGASVVQAGAGAAGRGLGWLLGSGGAGGAGVGAAAATGPVGWLIAATAAVGVAGMAGSHYATQRAADAHVAGQPIPWWTYPLIALQGLSGRGMPAIAEGLIAAHGQASQGPRSSRRPLLTDINFQSQFYGIEEQWRNFQRAAASTSPLRGEIMQIQSQQLETVLNAGFDRTVTAIRGQNPGMGD